MQVVNVLESVNDVPTRIWSYVVLFETDSHRIPIVKLAEEKFLSLVQERIFVPDEDVDSYLEDGLFDDDNGYKVAIVWSEPLN